MDASVKPESLENLWKGSVLAGQNAAYVEQLYEDYLVNPSSVSDEWRTWFDSLQSDNKTGADVSHQQIRNNFRQSAHSGSTHQNITPVTQERDAKQVSVLQLINAYRFLGHQIAKTDPLGKYEHPDIPELTLEYYKLSSNDSQTLFNTGSLVGPENASLSEIMNILKGTYGGSIGIEYMHISDTSEKRWIQEFIERRRGKPGLSAEVKKEICTQLIMAEALEKYLHNKYIGQKRFSLEGGECLIPILKELISRAGSQHKVKEMAIGMAHRGRLNVLVNLMGKIPADLFMEFEGKVENHIGTGDVKYHMGFSADFKTAGGPLHVSLAFNPSHLEIVSPVVEGSVRARQDRRNDKKGAEVIPVIIHGDAAFAAQGVVMETFSMSQSRGYSTKGTVHIVINNQIGFTSSSQEDARSTMYCTDVAKMVNAPILHVNGDDPEAVILVTRLALDYRMRFNKDIVIDMVCYRRHGHSEADEPMATQPLMYTTIKGMPTTIGLYVKKLLDEGVIALDETTRIELEYRDKMDAGISVVDEYIPENEARFPNLANWDLYKKRDSTSPVKTKVDKNILVNLHNQLEQLPDNFSLHPNVKRILDTRREMLDGKHRIDWGLAETMAYATLLNDGYSVRLSGQDSGRGTFFHRHAVLHDQKSGKTYIPLRNLDVGKAKFLVINSLLSEEAVLAFEYGYATTDPLTLTIWEAQFGDFANNAQVVIDQFISAGEQKWNRLCGLVMLLPHGLEGQGPEHSSARLERYLQLCAQHNIQVCCPTTAAQIFHLLRRQMLMHCRRPLIVMSPKGLLRHPAASSELSELHDGEFNLLIPETDLQDDDKVDRVIMCSGKVYYDLIDRRQHEQLENIAIIRIEQLYPFPQKQLQAQILRYPNLKKYVWCQEEPRNQGAWYSSQHHVKTAIGRSHELQYAGRPLLAAPAVGYSILHNQQKQKLVEDALGLTSQKKEAT